MQTLTTKINNPRFKAHCRFVSDHSVTLSKIRVLSDVELVSKIIFELHTIPALHYLTEENIIERVQNKYIVSTEKIIKTLRVMCCFGNISVRSHFLDGKEVIDYTFSIRNADGVSLITRSESSMVNP